VSSRVVTQNQEPLALVRADVVAYGLPSRSMKANNRLGTCVEGEGRQAVADAAGRSWCYAGDKDGGGRRPW
jgi:hypothetical protein